MTEPDRLGNEPSYEEASDPLEALRDGDPTPFERFATRAAPTLLGFFRRLGASREEAEDLTQDTLVKLYRSAPRYEARERFGALVFRVARNGWIDSERRRSVRPEASAGFQGEEGPESRIAAGEPSAERLAEASEEHARLEAALGRLSPGQREVFELGAIQELPYDEVGALLEIPVGTVKSRMFHAVKRLRELLAEAGGGPDGVHEEGGYA